MSASRLLRFLRATATAALATTFAFSLSQCAKGECTMNSECGGRGLCIDGECKIQCYQPIDCPSDRPVCSGGVCTAPDGGVVPDSAIEDSAIEDSATDTSVGPTDTGTPPPDTSTPEDTSTPPTDTGSEWPDTSVGPDTSTGTKSYLTKCSSGAECASGMCSPDTPSFCTKPCSSHSACANGQICAGGICRLDDIGRTGCSLSTAAPCLEYCYGPSDGAPASRHCTHSCTTASECPAGYACSPVAPGVKACVEIERPCSVSNQCPGNLCGADGLGCTAECQTAADCPHRLVGLPAYTCESRTISTGSGTTTKKVCITPGDVAGSGPLGATCADWHSCRSGACDDSTTPWTCAQRCTTDGGCAVGLGCFPLVNGGAIDLVCSAAASAWLGDTCARGRDCATAICRDAGGIGYCSRMCDDGYCPDGMTCTSLGVSATDGTPVMLCLK